MVRALRAVLYWSCIATTAAWGQALVPVDVKRDVPLSLDAGEAWSWHGLPQGEVAACGVEFALPAPAPGGALVTASAAALPEPAAVVYALVSPVVQNHLAAVDFHAGGEVVTVRAQDCALAWAAGEPHKRRLLVARAEAPEGDGITRVAPRGCYLFALVSGDRGAAADDALRAAYAAGQQEWAARFEEEQPPLLRLRRIADKIPADRLAVLPPRSGEPGVLRRALSVTRLQHKLAILQPEDLLDAERFSPERHPVVFYVGGERYHRTVREQSDALDALLRYVRDGGTLILATSGPYPMYYALDAGKPPEGGQSALRRLGIDIAGGWERPPEGQEVTIHPSEGQTLLPSLTEPWEYPTAGDRRLRCFNARAGSPVKVTPLLEVRADGKPAGLCAAVFELAEPERGGGTIVYISSVVINDPRVAEKVAFDLVSWIAERVHEKR